MRLIRNLGARNGRHSPRAGERCAKDASSVVCGAETADGEPMPQSLDVVDEDQRASTAAVR